MTTNTSNSHGHPDNTRRNPSGAVIVYPPNSAILDDMLPVTPVAASLNASVSSPDGTNVDAGALEALQQNLRKARALRASALDDVPPELHPVSQAKYDNGKSAIRLWDYVHTAQPIAMADIPLSLLNMYSHPCPPTLYLGYPVSSQFVIDISRGQHNAEVDRRCYPQPNKMGFVGSLTPMAAGTRLTEICDISIEIAAVTNGGGNLYVVALGSNKTFHRTFQEKWIHAEGMAKLREVLGVPKGEMPKWYLDAAKYRWGPEI